MRRKRRGITLLAAKLGQRYDEGTVGEDRKPRTRDRPCSEELFTRPPPTGINRQPNCERPARLLLWDPKRAEQKHTWCAFYSPFNTLNPHCMNFITSPLRRLRRRGSRGVPSVLLTPPSLGKHKNSSNDSLTIAKTAQQQTSAIIPREDPQPQATLP